MDVRKLLSLGMDAISYALCCSVLADDTNLSPKAAGILVASSSPFSVLQPQYIPCFPPVPSPGCHQLSVAPGRDLSHIRSMTERFFCASPQILEQDADTGQNKPACICCQQQDQLLGMVLRQTKLGNESNSNLNTGASIANHLYSDLQ